MPRDERTIMNDKLSNILRSVDISEHIAIEYEILLALIAFISNTDFGEHIHTHFCKLLIFSFVAG